MGRQRAGLVGRDAELTALRTVFGEPKLVVLRGRTGSGRTEMLAHARGELTGLGIVVLDVSGAARLPAWDRFGIGAILGALRERFEDLQKSVQLAVAIDSLSRVCTEKAYESVWGRARLLHALGAVFRTAGRIALVVDDADRLAQPVIALATARQVGHFVLASCVDDPELCATADLVVGLDPLSEEDADGVLRQVAGVVVDSTLRQALCSDLGPLYGNPGTVVSTVDELRHGGRLAVVHGQLCLRDPARPIALPAGHPLVAELTACGTPGRDLVRLVGGAGFGVDELPDLAAATGRPAAEYGQVVDRLVLAGVLDADAMGRLSLRCRALGAAVAGDASELHRAIAIRLVETGGRPSVLKRHIVAAGDALPRQAELSGLLRDPPDAAGHYAAWWHAEDRARAAAEFVRFCIRTADYAWLARFVERVPVDDLDPDELAAAAVLVALHSGRPVPGNVRAAVAGSAALEFYDRWSGDRGVVVNDVVAAFGGSGEWHVRGVMSALEVRDLVPVLASVLGDSYGIPAEGPLAAYHRVLAGYAGGDWTAALGAARELDLDPRADVLARQNARLHAAEMSGWRGEDRRARAWLESVPERDCAFPVLRSWVEAGLRYHAGDVAGVLSARRHEGAGPGTSRLLRRIAEVAAESGDARHGRRVLAEAERVSTPWSAEARETVWYVRGLVNGDHVPARAAERLIRRRGNRFELSLACHLVGRTTGEPQPWLTEAYEIAQALGAARLAARTRRSLRTGRSASGGERALSEAELRIIELVRLGRTNRQIALAVRLSEKTVAKHLTRLYAKAGCRTRHGLATSALGRLPEPLGA